MRHFITPLYFILFGLTNPGSMKTMKLLAGFFLLGAALA